jgi:hypothetical protein
MNRWSRWISAHVTLLFSARPYIISAHR